jgi:heme A synthase
MLTPDKYYEGVFSIANMLILLLCAYLGHLIIIHRKKTKSKTLEYWDFMMFLIILLIIRQMVGILDVFQLFSLPGKGALIELIIVASILYLLLNHQNQWKIEKSTKIEKEIHIGGNKVK